MNKFLISVFILSQLWILSHATPRQTRNKVKKEKRHEPITVSSTVKSLQKEHMFKISGGDTGEEVGEGEPETESEPETEYKDELCSTKNEKKRQNLEQIIIPPNAKIFEEEYMALHNDENGLIDHERYTRWPKLEGKANEELSAVCEKFLNFFPHSSELEHGRIIYKHLETDVIMRVRILICKLGQYSYHLLESNYNECVYYAKKLEYAGAVSLESKICETIRSSHIYKLFQSANEMARNIIKRRKKKTVQANKLRQSARIKEMKYKKEEIQTDDNLTTGENKKPAKASELKPKIEFKKIKREIKHEKGEVQMKTNAIARKNNEPVQLLKLKPITGIEDITQEKEKIQTINSGMAKKNKKLVQEPKLKQSIGDQQTNLEKEENQMINNVKEPVQINKLKQNTGETDIKYEEKEIQMINNMMAQTNKEQMQVPLLKLSTDLKETKCEEEVTQTISNAAVKRNKKLVQVPKLKPNSKIKEIKRKQEEIQMINNVVVGKNKQLVQVRASTRIKRTKHDEEQSQTISNVVAMKNNEPVHEPKLKQNTGNKKIQNEKLVQVPEIKPSIAIKKISHEEEVIQNIGNMVVAEKSKEPTEIPKLKQSTGFKKMECASEQIQAVSDVDTGKNFEPVPIPILESSTNIKESKYEKNEIRMTNNMVEGEYEETGQIFKQTTRTKNVECEKEDSSNIIALNEKSKHYSTMEQRNQNNMKTKLVKLPNIDGLHGRKYRPMKDLYK